ncbi:MAG: glycosyltransferase family 2 protein [Pseudomonadota bacterium]
MKSVIIIPALNEQDAIGGVVRGVKHQVDRVIVVDNGSSDRTAERAIEAGADVVVAQPAGYGRACLAGVAAAPEADLLIFMDGDGADDPSDLESLITPIRIRDVDFVVGSRALGNVQRGALTLTQRWGNALATSLMKVFWGGSFSDLGPFRAIERKAYERLNMQAPTFGWTVEMQVRALKLGLKCHEVPVSYRRRIGVSKISGTIKGVIFAGAYILGTIFKEALLGHRTVRGRLNASSYAGVGRAGLYSQNSLPQLCVAPED